MKELIIIAVIIAAGLSPPVSSTNIIFMLMDDVSATIGRITAQVSALVVEIVENAPII